MNHTSFNMSATTSVIQQNWKKIVFFTLLSALVATVTVLLMPERYRSTAKLLSANAQLADKSRLFNENIQSLYSYFGSGDDLDRIMGIADLDTSYKQLVDKYQLVDYYQLSNRPLPELRRKAVLQLKEDLSFQRTEEGQMKIICWTKDPQLSAMLVNTLITLVEQQLQTIWQMNYQTAYDQLNRSIAYTENLYATLSDSVSQASPAQSVLLQKHMETLLDQLAGYRKTAATFKLMGASVPAALYVLEPAVPAAKAERPDKPAVILTAALAGCIFSIFVLLLANRKQV